MSKRTAERFVNSWQWFLKALFSLGLGFAVMPILLQAQVKETFEAARGAAESVGKLSNQELLALVAVASVAGLVITQWMSNRAQMAVSDKISDQTKLIAAVKEDTTILVHQKRS